MKERMIQVTCPHCGHVFEIKRDTFVIARMNSVIDQRLEDGTYFTHVCQKCFNPFYLLHPFMYRDPIKKYIIILSNQKEFTNLPPNEKVIRTRNAKQFLLAYKVYSRQLNLKFVLAKLNQMKNKYQCNVEFMDYDDDKHCRWFKIRDEQVALILKEYEIENVYDNIDTR